MDVVGMLKALFMFLFKFSEALIMVLPDLLKTIRAWSEYWQQKNQRYKDAIAHEVETKIKAQERQSRKELANLKASMLIYEEVWKDTYKQFLAHLESGTPELALLMLREEHFAEANEIIFNSNSSLLYKAKQLTDILRRQ